MTSAKRLGLLVAMTSAMAFPSCGDGEKGPPSLTCSASCTLYRWNFETGTGANAEWCDPRPPASGGSASCTSHSYDTSQTFSCSASGSLRTCSGTIIVESSGHTYMVSSTEDLDACTLSVSVDGALTCTAP
jgi:hypothetical protein